MLFDTLGLHDHYAMKLKLQHANIIREDILKISLNLCQISDPKQLPFVILHKIMSYDTTCRSDLMHVKTIENDEDSISISNADNYHDHNSCDLHPVDGILAILLCSDDLLRQDLYSRLAKCQIAVPFILPDPFSKELILPLWALRSIFCEWTDSAREKKQQIYSMVTYPMPIVSILRFGKQQLLGPSKSKILNEVISDDHHTRFFHRDCPGGRYTSVLVDGLVDMSWYFPSGESTDIFQNPVTFLNLHGDARNHPYQTKFLAHISSACFILLLENDLEIDSHNMAVIIKLYSSPNGLIILNGTEKVPEILRKRFPKLHLISLIALTTSQINEKIRKKIRTVIDETKNFNAVAAICQMGFEGITVDEHSDLHKKCYRRANKIIKLFDTSNLKESIFPLQGELWKLWASYDKELHRMTLRKNETIITYAEKMKIMKSSVMGQQLIHIESLSPAIKCFLDSLSEFRGVSNLSLRKFFLQSLKLELNSLSQKRTLEKQQRYYLAQQELSDLKARGYSEAAEAKINKLQMELKYLDKEILDHSFNLENLFREVGLIYENSLQTQAYRKIYSYLPKLVADLVVEGYPLEIMDGEASHVLLKWIVAVLIEVVKLLNNPKVFVLSVLGLRRTGKSTMLKTVFGLQFHVSAERNTHGAFVQLLKLDDNLKSQTKCDYVLLIDTKRLHAPELDLLKIQKCDSELATFVMGLANTTLIHIYDKIPDDMYDILQTSVHAFIRLTQVKYHPSCQFVHQNAGVDLKGESCYAKLTQKLNKITIDVAREEKIEDFVTSFNDVIKFNYRTDVHYFPELWNSHPPMAPINSGYTQAAQALKYHLIQIISNRAKETVTLEEKFHLDMFRVNISDLWDTLLKETYVFSMKDPLEITAYNFLETQCSKCDSLFQSAIVDWEQHAGKEIGSEPLESVLIKTLEKLKELQEFVSKIFDAKISDRNALFNKYQMETLIQLKGRLERQLTQIADGVKYRAEEHCGMLLQNRLVEYIKGKVQKYIDIIKKEQLILYKSLTQRKLDLQQLQKLRNTELFSPEKVSHCLRHKLITADEAVLISYITADGKLTEYGINILQGKPFDGLEHILKYPHQTEQNLNSSFDDIWKELINILPPVKSTPQLSITYEVEKALIHFIADLKGCNSQITSVLQKKSQGQMDLDFQPQREKHFTINRHVALTGTELLYHKVFGITDPYQIQAIQITETIFNEAHQYLQRITKTDTNFNPAFIYELLQLIGEKIAKCSSTNQCSITFTPEYNFEVYIRVCKYAIPKFQEMSDSFTIWTDPIIYLEKYLKGQLLTSFKNQYKQTEAEEGIAGTLSAYFKTPVCYNVERNLGCIMATSMISSEKYFSDKYALKVKVLTDLYHRNDFQEYMAYIKDAKQSLKDHIEHYTMLYCDQKLPKGNLTRLQHSAREQIFQLFEVIEEVISQISDTNVQAWLINFCNHTDLRELEVLICYQEFRNYYNITLQELDLTNFKRVFEKELHELKNTLVELFSKTTYEKSIHWKERPYELLESLVGCTAQCPFCKEQCDLLEHHVNDADHRTEVHRIDCLAGWRIRDTKVMTTDFCPALVCGEKFFYKPDGERHPYKDYRSVYHNWSIPPDTTARSCLYWKWFVSTHRLALAKEYNALPPEVPPHWSQITWQEIKKDLESTYHIR